MRRTAEGKDDDVGLEERAVLEADAVGLELLDLDALLDLDLAVADELGAADVEVVSAAVAEVLRGQPAVRGHAAHLHEQAAGVAVDLKASLLERVERL